KPDIIESYAVTQCELCAASLESTFADGYEERQVFDIPLPKIDVTAHRAEKKKCTSGHITTAILPSEITASVQYGTRIKAAAVYLNQYQLIPYARVEESLESLYGVSLCEGTLFNSNQKVHENLEETEGQIKSALQQEAVLHVDESGIRVEGKLHWLHSASTEKLTHDEHHKKRGQIAMDAIDILPNYNGILVHDHLKAYLLYTDCSHSLCNAHHLRELIFLLEKSRLEWAGEMVRLLVTLHRSVERAKRRQQTELQPKLQQLFSLHYDALIQRGLDHESMLQAVNSLPPIPKKRGRPKQSKAKNLLDRLKSYKTETLRFMTDFRVPFDNNQAERMFFRIRSYLSSARKQGHNMLTALIACFQGCPLILVDAE
ncbi:MAG: IS66 family transposase, partial [Methylococcaceae bacterium]|nr:IS66 family transposase [Methylococcaceae bacterium]